MLRTTTSPSRTTGVGAIAPTARIAACGGLMTATKLWIPNMPRLDTVNVPDESSGGVIAPARTRSASARDSRGDLAERLAVGVEHGRDDERVLAGHRDADVHARVELELAVAVGAVRAREVDQRERAGLDHEVVERRHRLALGGGRLELLAQVDGLLHVDVDVEHEVRRGGLRLRHPPRDRLLEAREVLRRRLALAGLRVAGHDRRRGLALLLLRLGLGPAAGASAFAPSPLAAASTSALTIRPPGPVPWSCPSSSPSSRAIRRATGDALARPPLPPPAGSGAASPRRLGRAPVAAGSSRSAVAVCVLRLAAFGSSPPSSASAFGSARPTRRSLPPPIDAIVSPTASVSPSWATIFSVPSWSAS